MGDPGQRRTDGRRSKTSTAAFAAACSRFASMNSGCVMDSARPRAGRRFEPIQEVELEKDALLAARSLPGAHRGLSIIREAAGPFGVPDLLVLVGPPALLAQRRELEVPPLLNQIDAGIVSAAAPQAPRSVEVLARRLGWSGETVARRVPSLVRCGALIQTSSGLLLRPAALVPTGRLYAVETKVKNWRRAVQQARTYSGWCDSYLIVMPTLSVGSLSQLSEAVAYDSGGLVTDGRFVARPKIRPRPATQRLWGAEHFLAAIEGARWP